ncbi:MAG: hypothetical protein ACE5IJ_00295 [Thermoplasmata archaeon]
MISNRMKTVRELFEAVSDLLTYEEFRAKASDKVRKFGGLITEDAAALLVVEELGRFKVDYDRIADIQGDQAVRVRANVVTIGELKKFRKKDESVGRVVNISISDDSGECRLVLWDDDTQLVSKGAVEIGGRLRVINGYSKVTDFGVEITKGRYGAIVVE